MVGVRDRDIRARLRAELAKEHAGDPDTLMVEEMGLCQGDARIDVAVINGSLNGFEIKSAMDTLERLPSQERIYSAVMDSMTILTSGSHLDGVLSLIPTWWGVIAVEYDDEKKLGFSKVRQSADNPQPDPCAVVQLLWRAEALAILEARGLDWGVRSKPKRTMWDRLLERLEWPDLHAEVRRTLKSRDDWSIASPLA